MQAADVSCYAAKEAGRNRVHLWFDTDEIMRARLRDVDGSLVLPGRFLPAAERYQLATRLDRFVLKNAIELLVPHASTAKVDMLFINLSGQSIGDQHR